MIARPFPKFHNVGEHANPALDPIPLHLPFKAFDKHDGSLIIVGRDPLGGVSVTTRGSFTSTQAIAAHALLANEDVPEGKTWLFELVAPWNQVVLPYDEERLILLAAIDNATGLDDDDEFARLAATYPHVTPLDFATLEDVCAVDRDGIEGFVVRFDNGFRVKSKVGWYIALHKIVSGISTTATWEALAEGTFDAYVAQVPDEFHPWLHSIAAGMTAEHERLCAEIATARSAIADLPTRKDYALAAKETPYMAELMLAYDVRDYSRKVWNRVRPPYARPGEHRP